MCQEKENPDINCCQRVSSGEKRRTEQREVPCVGLLAFAVLCRLAAMGEWRVHVCEQIASHTHIQNLRAIREWINIHILTGILNNSFARHYHGRKSDKGNSWYCFFFLLCIVPHWHRKAYIMKPLSHGTPVRVILGCTWQREFLCSCWFFSAVPALHVLST